MDFEALDEPVEVEVLLAEEDDELESEAKLSWVPPPPPIDEPLVYEVLFPLAS